MTTALPTDLAGRLAGRCSGAVVGVLRDGVAELSVWGDRVSGEPITPPAVFDLASVTKLATAVAVGRAVVTGHLGVNDTVAELAAGLPGAEHLGPLGAATVANLLRHRSGLAPWAPLYLLAGSSEEAVAWILRSPLRTRPGEAFAYSDLGLVLLGALLARRTGTPVGVLQEEAVAELAGRPVLTSGGSDPAVACASADGDTVEHAMVTTGEPYPVPAGLPVDGFGWRTGLVVGQTSDGNAWHAFGGVAGHAGAFASVPGLLAWGGGLLDALTGRASTPAARGVRVLLAAPVLDGAGGDGQGLGFRYREVAAGGARRAGGTPMWWHPGFTGTALAVLPERRLVVALGASRLLVPDPVPTTELFDDVLEGLLR